MYCSVLFFFKVVHSFCGGVFLSILINLAWFGCVWVRLGDNW
jgi:hypothetical protein